jgi:hypothetical protein
MLRCCRTEKPNQLSSLRAHIDWHRTVHSIRSVYRIPVTSNQPLFSDIYKGPYQEWAALISRPPQLRGFPLTAFVPLPIERTIIFSDCARWNQPRTAKP